MKTDEEKALDMVKMKTKIYLLVFLLTISLASAVSIYSGDSTTIQLSEQYSYFVITGNLSSVNISQNISTFNVTIIPDKYSTDSNISIIFYDERNEVIESGRSSSNHHHDDGGGDYIKPKNNTIIPNITNNSIPPIELKPAEKKTNYWIWILVGLIIIVFLYTLYILTKHTQKNEKLNSKKEVKNGKNRKESK